jgi:hypothetical protein
MIAVILVYDVRDPEWSSYNRIWFSGPDKQEIVILIQSQRVETK